MILRLHKPHIVQTSKGIALTTDECARLWRLISKWHDNEQEFDLTENPVAMTIGGTDWKISLYKNDLLTAGCHTIAYQEMKNMAELLNLV